MEPDDSTLAMQLLHAFVRMKRMHWRHASEGGLTTSEIMVLSCIKRAVPLDGPGLRVSDISSRLAIASPTMTQQLNDLEARGLVTRNTDPDDRRAVRICLTARGDIVTAMSWNSFLASFKELVAHLGPEDSLALVALLTRAHEYFESAPTPPRGDGGNPSA
ncbi:MAG TPA: MarR family winged helix-turn-helix transcriptional regulator [Chloroflexia bacterium]|nr:MarR family winged helix-turn-helix transcriptional regulator [Chloroflexia bacterium]